VTEEEIEAKKKYDEGVIDKLPVKWLWVFEYVLWDIYLKMFNDQFFKIVNFNTQTNPTFVRAEIIGWYNSTHWSIKI
jgi:hypothetical protein